MQAPSQSNRESASPPGLRIGKSVPLEPAAGMDNGPASTQQVLLGTYVTLSLGGYTVLSCIVVIAQALQHNTLSACNAGNQLNGLVSY